MYRSIRRRGFTLLEMIVVLVIVCLVTALAMPALLPARRARADLGALVPAARQAAAQRGEVIYLRIAGSGQWRLEGASSPAAGPVAAGQVEPFPGLPLTLVVSPLGSCGFDLRSAAAARLFRLDPLTCDIATE